MLFYYEWNCDNFILKRVVIIINVHSLLYYVTCLTISAPFLLQLLSFNVKFLFCENYLLFNFYGIFNYINKRRLIIVLAVYNYIGPFQHYFYFNLLRSTRLQNAFHLFTNILF